MNREPTKEELKEWIKNERNVFLNSFFDLINQRKEMEQQIERLQEQLNEANEVLKDTAHWATDETENQRKARDYLKKWGVK